MGFMGSDDLLEFGIAITATNTASKIMEEVQNDFQNLVGSIEGYSTKIVQSFDNIKLGVATLLVGLGLMSPAFATLNAAGMLEQSTVSYEVMLGSASKAYNMLSELKKSAAQTPYEFTHLDEGARMMLNFGVAAKDVIPNLSMLGDIASGDAFKFQRLNLAFSQTFASGKLQGQDLLQFINAGFNPLQELSSMTGRTMESLKDQMHEGGISFNMVADAIKHVTSEGGRFYEMNEKQSQSYLGMISTVKDYFGQAASSIGGIFLPIAKVLLGWLGEFAQGLKVFAENPIGKFIIGLTVAMGFLITAFGAWTIASNLAAAASGYLAVTYGKLGLTTIMTAFAQQGLAAGLRSVAASAWAAMAPIIPYALAVGAVVGVVLLANKAIDEFKEVLNGQQSASSQWVQWLQKMGGVMVGIGEIFTSWNGKTFELSEGVHNALENLGILEFVVNLGTWVVRIKEFLKGMRDGFVTSFGVMKNVFNSVLDAISPLRVIFDYFFADIERNTSAIEKWNTAGEVLAYVLTGIGVALVATFWPIALITASVLTAIYVFHNWGNMIDWFSNQWNMMVEILRYGFNIFVDWFMALPDRFINWGAEMVQNIKNGLLGEWDAFVKMLEGLIQALPGGQFIIDAITNPSGLQPSLQPIGNVQPIYGGPGVDDYTTQPGNPLGDISRLVGRQKAQQQLPPENRNTVIEKSHTERVENVTLQIDGQTVANIINEINETNQNRRSSN